MNLYHRVYEVIHRWDLGGKSWIIILNATITNITTITTTTTTTLNGINASTNDVFTEIECKYTIISFGNFREIDFYRQGF